MILDTEFLIAIDNQNEQAVSLATDLETRSVPLRIPTVVVQELYVSVGAGAHPTGNVDKYEEQIAANPVVPLDENIARRAGVIEGQHLMSDEDPTLGPVDSVVAATGLVFNEAVVTDDPDFRTVDGLRVELY